jgi:acid phosphatase family membrane protein YuiD
MTVFLSAATSWFFAQLLKVFSALPKTNKRNARELLEIILWRTGGMPSGHAALVCSMTASIAFTEGLSNLFVISLFISLIEMRDAMGVRRSSGNQARTLNNLGRSLNEQCQVDFHPVKEVYGHTPLEVVIGALLGVCIAAAYAYL